MLVKQHWQLVAEIIQHHVLQSSLVESIRVRVKVKVTDRVRVRSGLGLGLGRGVLPDIRFHFVYCGQHRRFVIRGTVKNLCRHSIDA